MHESGGQNMANIFDYLDWRGDISFTEDPFNVVDNLILSWMAYVGLDEVMPCGICNEPITIKDASARFFQLYDLEEKLKGVCLTRTSVLLFSKLAECSRFQNMRILNYVNHISEELQKQFSAMTIEIDKNTLYIAFRGTDDTIVGWREDFNMSFQPVVPSQIEAANYLEETVKGRSEKLIVGGHSKGGNLAVYASMKASKDVKNRIIRVYNNDGPGFQKYILESSEYQEIIPKVKTIVPESSIIGMLLGHEEEYEIVHSSQRGIMQHDAGTWEVMRNSFVYLDSVSNASKFLDNTIKEWIATLDTNQRKEFVDRLFEILESQGAKTTNELSAMGLKNLVGAIKVIGNMDPVVKRNLSIVVKSLFSIINQNLKTSFRKELNNNIGNTV